MRVTQGVMYNTFLTGMNRNLSDLMESSIQSSSQKKVNKPSDDPSGAGRILSTRATITSIQTYAANINDAMGWLSTADGIVGSGTGSVQTALTRLKELATQGSSETYDASNREQISSEIRQLYEQLLNLANTRYDSRYIFAGQISDKGPYEQMLAADCYTSNASDPDSIAGADLVVQGGASRSVIIQATTSGAAESAKYRYSEDGGKTWKDATVTADTPKAPECTIQAGGVSVRVTDGSKTVEAVDTANTQRADNGTWLIVRPTALYTGNDNSNQVVRGYGTTITGEATGSFSRNVAVRVDSVDNGVVNYSYSIDDGSNWIKGSAPQNTAMAVPGGYLSLSGVPKAGDQFQIQPHRADISFQIGEKDTITVNMVGMDIFGGYYKYPQDTTKDYATPVDGTANLFETVGKLLAAAECNSPDDMGKAVEELDNVMKLVMTKAAEVGGRENRLEITMGALSIRQYTEEDKLSVIEDVDVSELMTRLSQQQVAYTSVLKSSSMIMQMSLVNYL